MRAKRFSHEEIKEAIQAIFRKHPAARLRQTFLVRTVAQNLTGKKYPRVATRQVREHILFSNYLNRVAGVAGGVEMKHFWRE